MSTPATSPPPYPSHSPITRLFKFLYRLSGRKRSVDSFLTPMLGYRHYLPVAVAEELIPGFAESRVTIVDLPRGPWSTPLVDTLTVVKSAIGFGSKKLLEIGSYKGATAKLLAENTPATTEVWPLDHEAEHGSAYRGLPIESRIHRIVGSVSVETLRPHGPFDFIFVDADHDYQSVWEHSMCAFEMLAPGGVILWHDYQHKDYLHGQGGVPEGLNAVQKATGKSIVSIQGTTLCIYSEHAGWETSRHASSSIRAESDPWKDSTLPGQ